MQQAFLLLLRIFLPFCPLFREDKITFVHLVLNVLSTLTDSATSNDVMQAVRAIGDSGRTVCATIHSPTRVVFFVYSIPLYFLSS